MKFRNKEILLGLLLFFSFFAVKAQEPNSSPTPPIAVEDDEMVCGLRSPQLIQFRVLVWSSKKGYLKDLNFKDFVVYDEKEKQEIEFFIFDELTNQYIIGFYPKDFILDNKWREIRVKVKLSAEKKKESGKILVLGQNGFYPNQN